MRVIAYCIKCKREIIKARDYADAFKAIGAHLQRRHSIAWCSPSGIPLKELAEVWLKYIKGANMDAYDEEALSEILNDFNHHKKFFYNPKKPRQGFIADVFAVFLDAPGIRRAFIEKIRERKKARWVYPQKFKAMRRHEKLISEYYQTQRGQELRHKYAELKRKRAELLKAFVERGLGTEEDFHQLLKKLKEEEERERRARIKEEREREWERLTPQEKLGLYPEALCGQRPTAIRKKLFGV